MGDIGKQFTLYDLIGYFAVGGITLIAMDAAWAGAGAFDRLKQYWEWIKVLTAFQAGFASVVFYMIGQLMGAISKPISLLPWNRYPEKAADDWDSLNKQILGPRAAGTAANPSSVFGLCAAYAKEATPVVYGDAFKLLVYAGASRSLTLVAFAAGVIGACHGMPLYWWVPTLALVPGFYYNFIRLSKQYHGEVLNGVRLLLLTRLPPRKSGD